MNARLENTVNLASLLNGRNPNGDGNTAYVVDLLQALARKAHRNAERMCNGELPECRKCKGDGHGCQACLETGYPTLAREAKAVERLRKALEPYRLRVYEQGDPRGWPLYLIPEDMIPAEGLEDYIYPIDPPEGPSLETLRARWIASNYNRGAGVCPY